MPTGDGCYSGFTQLQQCCIMELQTAKSQYTGLCYCENNKTTIFQFPCDWESVRFMKSIVHQKMYLFPKLKRNVETKKDAKKTVRKRKAQKHEGQSFPVYCVLEPRCSVTAAYPQNTGAWSDGNSSGAFTAGVFSIPVLDLIGILARIFLTC